MFEKYGIIVYLNMVVLRIKNFFLQKTTLSYFYLVHLFLKMYNIIFTKHTFKNNIFQVIEPASNYIHFINKIFSIWNTI